MFLSVFHIQLILKSFHFLLPSAPRTLMDPVETSNLGLNIPSSITFFMLPNCGPLYIYSHLVMEEVSLMAEQDIGL